ncbi:MAG: hypothetical protein LBJ95_01895 [Oscillospiraceae bacterium]|jgi:hypothetical protein|nr:hypothetical protein [Oscillospiraceae bacterium]
MALSAITPVNGIDAANSAVKPLLFQKVCLMITLPVALFASLQINGSCGDIWSLACNPF